MLKAKNDSSEIVPDFNLSNPTRNCQNHPYLLRKLQIQIEGLSSPYSFLLISSSFFHLGFQTFPFISFPSKNPSQSHTISLSQVSFLLDFLLCCLLGSSSLTFLDSFEAKKLNTLMRFCISVCVYYRWKFIFLDYM